MKKGIIFDLDGTLWDSAENVCKAWNEVFHFRYPTLRKTITVPELHSYMGKTPDVIGELMFPDLDPALRKEIIDACGSHENEFLLEKGGILYPDVVETLERLREHYSLFIVSNCQEGYIEGFLEFYELGFLFEDFESAGRTGLSKAENNRLVMERNDVSLAVYVGDTQGDLDSADSAGIAFIHAAYGFGNTNRPTAKINAFSELPSIVEKLLK